jgi:hypothetical protein
VLHVLAEQHAVGQARQGVVVRHVDELRLEALALGEMLEEVVEGAPESRDLVGAANGEAGVRVGPPGLPDGDDVAGECADRVDHDALDEQHHHQREDDGNEGRVAELRVRARSPEPEAEATSECQAEQQDRCKLPTDCAEHMDLTRAISAQPEDASKQAKGKARLSRVVKLRRTAMRKIGGVQNTHPRQRDQPSRRVARRRHAAAPTATPAISRYVRRSRRVRTPGTPSATGLPSMRTIGITRLDALV